MLVFTMQPAKAVQPNMAAGRPSPPAASPHRPALPTSSIPSALQSPTGSAPSISPPGQLSHRSPPPAPSSSNPSATQPGHASVRFAAPGQAVGQLAASPSPLSSDPGKIPQAVTRSSPAPPSLLPGRPPALTGIRQEGIRSPLLPGLQLTSRSPPRLIIERHFTKKFHCSVYIANVARLF